KVALYLGWLALGLVLEGQIPDSERVADKALSELVEISNGAVHATVYYQVAFVKLTAGKPREAVNWAQRCVDTSLPLGETPTYLLGLKMLGVARTYSGEFDAGQAVLRECLQLARDSGQQGVVAACLSFLGHSACEFHELTEATRYLT